MEHKPLMSENETTLTLPNIFWNSIIRILIRHHHYILAETLKDKLNSAHSTVHKQGC